MVKCHEERVEELRGKEPLDRPISGWELFRVPEFQSLCDRLGIAWRLPTRSLTIEIPCFPEDVVRITHHYLTGGEITATEFNTTTVHNKRFQTVAPAANPDAFAQAKE